MTKQINNTSLRAKYTKAFRLLDLPAELRNSIYEKVAEERPAWVRKISRGNLSCLSALRSANRQVRREFLAVLPQFAECIVVEVSNWDFAHFVTFLNTLSDQEHTSLSTLTWYGSLRVCIHLCVLCDLDINTDLLARWLNRMGSSTKKGSDIDVRYRIIHSIDRSKHSSGSTVHLRHWAKWLAKKAQRLQNGRIKVEAEKLVTALKVYV